MLYFNIFSYNQIPSFDQIPTDSELETLMKNSQYIMFSVGNRAFYAEKHYKGKNKLQRQTIIKTGSSIDYRSILNHNNVYERNYELPLNRFSINSFKSIFDTRTNSIGKIRNKILFSFWKVRFKRDYCGVGSSIISMSELINFILSSLHNNRPMFCPEYKRPIFGTELDLNFNIPDAASQIIKCQVVNFEGFSKNYVFYSKKYSSSFNGRRIQQDFKVPNCFKVFDVETNQICYVKPSKIILDVLETNRAFIGLQATIYCAEVFQKWYESEIIALENRYTLHVDKYFDKIYSSSYCISSFGSCMCNKGQWRFYTKNVNASAAYLTDSQRNNKIVARCILYHNVKQRDNDSVSFNYAERQYAETDFLKILLIRKLLQENLIDIYKTTGAGCRETHNILDKDGNDLQNTDFYIDCNIECGDTLSFMDTFAFYFPSMHKAANYLIQRNGYREIAHTTPTYQFTD